MVQFKYGEKLIDVEDTSSVMDTWTVIQSETVEYSAASVIVKNFTEQFSSISLLGEDSDSKYEFLCKLVSRNSKLLEWYAAQKLKYSDLAQLPLFAKDLIKPEEFKSLQIEMTNISDIVKSSVDKRIEASKVYKVKLKQIDDEERKLINKIKGDDSVIKILTLNSSKLPLTLSLAIENFTPTGDSNKAAENKRIFVRETLIQYKVGLLKFIKNNPDTDIDDVVDKLGLK